MYVPQRLITLNNSIAQLTGTSMWTRRPCKNGGTTPRRYACPATHRAGSCCARPLVARICTAMQTVQRAGPSSVTVATSMFLGPKMCDLRSHSKPAHRGKAHEPNQLG